MSESTEIERYYDALYEAYFRALDDLWEIGVSLVKMLSVAGPETSRIVPLSYLYYLKTDALGTTSFADGAEHHARTLSTAIEKADQQEEFASWGTLSRGRLLNLAYQLRKIAESCERIECEEESIPTTPVLFIDYEAIHKAGVELLRAATEHPSGLNTIERELAKRAWVSEDFQRFIHNPYAFAGSNEAYWDDASRYDLEESSEVYDWVDFGNDLLSAGIVLLGNEPSGVDAGHEFRTALSSLRRAVEKTPREQAKFTVPAFPKAAPILAAEDPRLEAILGDEKFDDAVTRLTKELKLYPEEKDAFCSLLETGASLSSPQAVLLKQGYVAEGLLLAVAESAKPQPFIRFGSRGKKIHGPVVPSIALSKPDLARWIEQTAKSNAIRKIVEDALEGVVVADFGSRSKLAPVPEEATVPSGTSGGDDGADDNENEAWDIGDLALERDFGGERSASDSIGDVSLLMEHLTEDQRKFVAELQALEWQERGKKEKMTHTKRAKLLGRSEISVRKTISRIRQAAMGVPQISKRARDQREPIGAEKTYREEMEKRKRKRKTHTGEAA